MKNDFIVCDFVTIFCINRSFDVINKMLGELIVISSYQQRAHMSIVNVTSIATMFNVINKLSINKRNEIGDHADHFSWK